MMSETKTSKKEMTMTNENNLPSASAILNIKKSLAKIEQWATVAAFCDRSDREKYLGYANEEFKFMKEQCMSAATEQTCKCGEWEISEYGEICPSCPEGQARILENDEVHPDSPEAQMQREMEREEVDYISETDEALAGARADLAVTRAAV